MLTSLFSFIHMFLPLGFYLVTIVIFLISSFWRPHLGLYYLAFFLPLENVRYWLHVYPFGEKFVDIVLLGVFVGILTRRGGTGESAIVAIDTGFP